MLVLSAGYLCLGEHYENLAYNYVLAESRSIDAGCQSDQHCKVPSGWNPDQDRASVYFTVLPGAIPLRVELRVFDASEFSLHRNVEDGSGASGGVGKPLVVWNRKLW